MSISKKLNNILKTEQIEQRTAEWYKIRCQMITASQCASILDCDGYTSSEKLLDKKCNPEQISNTKATQFGITYEPIAINIYSKLYNTKVYELGLIKHPKYNFIGASVDGITSECNLVEIKCVVSRSIHYIPIKYWIQTQIQMEVLNLEYCDLFQCKFINCSKQEYLLNKKSIFYGINNNKYWKLFDYTCNRIKRNKNWFNDNFQRLFDFDQDLKI